MKALRKFMGVAAVSACLLVGAMVTPALAHHSFAMYDLSRDKVKTMSGKIIRFVINGNHCQYIFEILNDDGTPIKDAEGKAVTWTVETGASSQLAAQGITANTFKAGSIINIAFSPLKDGRNAGAQQSPSVIHCGDKMPKGGCNASTGKAYPENPGSARGGN